MGPVALTCVCVFESGLSTTIRVSLIVAPDRLLLTNGFGWVLLILFFSNGIGSRDSNPRWGDLWESVDLDPLPPHDHYTRLQRRLGAMNPDTKLILDELTMCFDDLELRLDTASPSRTRSGNRSSPI